MRFLDEAEQDTWRDRPLPFAPQPTLAQARAVLESALSVARPSAVHLKPYQRLGDYELLDRLGQGATAAVYRARQISLNRMVALKLMSDPDLASEAEVQRFIFGAEAAAELEHPHIAPIYYVGAERGVPFFTMRLFEGGTLAQSIERLRRSRRQAIALMAKVARAVHHAHERGVLHRDLKPANIVLDAHGEPHVVDFGFAKRLDERALTSKPSLLVGTVGYMAPEQAAGKSRSLTFASDVYALGAILYELLVGEAPYKGLGLAEFFAQLASPEPVRSPRDIDPSVDRALELVCLKCLEKDPARRYRTALEFALDLERWLQGKLPSVTPETRLERVWRWCCMHPALTTLVAGAVCVLAATAGVATSVGREERQVLLGEVRHANLYAAEAKAGEVLSQLRALADPVARCASDVRIADLLSRTGFRRVQPGHADRLLVECGAKTLFDSVAVVNRDGIEQARLPRRTFVEPPHELMRRDAFTGAKRLAQRGYRSIHVGRVLRSEQDGERQVSLSAPVFDMENQWLGVLHVTVSMKAFLESLRLHDNGRQIAVLAGVREREAADPPAADDQGVMVLLHGQLGDAQGISASGPWMKELTRLKNEAAGRHPFRVSEPDHSLEDNPQTYSVTAFGDRWLAGFAPVGHTGYAVVVQTKYELALEAIQRALLRLLGWSSAMFVLGASAVLLLAWLLERRMRIRRA